MKNIVKIFIVLVFSAVTFAQNYGDILRYSNSEVTSNARSLAMGNSVASFESGISGINFNPASLGLANYSQFSFGLNLNRLETNAEFFGSRAIQDKATTNFNSIGFVSKVPTKRGAFVFGFSYDRSKDFSKFYSFNAFNSSNTSMIKSLAYSNDRLAYDLGLSYEVYDNSGEYLYDDTKIDGNLTQFGNTRMDGFTDRFSGALAVEWGRNLFVGFTVSLISGEFEQERFFGEIDSQNFYGDDLQLDDSDERTKGFETFEFNDRIFQDVFGYSFTAGFLYKFRNGFNLAGTIKTPEYIEIKEKYRVKGYAKFAENEFETDWFYSDINYDVKTPFEFKIAGSFHERNFTLAGDVTFINYKQMEFTNGFSKDDEDYKNQVIDENFRSVINFNAGFEYKVPKMPLKLRAGFIYKKSPYKDDEEKYDKKIITAGCGFKFTRNIYFDAAYMYGWWDDLADNYDVGDSRTYQEMKKSNFVFNFTLRL